VSTNYFLITLIGLGAVLAGGLGSALRLALSHWHGRLPWGILVGNSVASLVVGLTYSTQNGEVASFVLSLGFAGGLSTFSSWAAQTVHYYRQGDNRKGTYNLLLNLLLPALCVIAGMILSPLLLK
jgi:CrcB protein